MKYITTITVFILITAMFSCEKCKEPIPEPRDSIIKGEWVNITEDIGSSYILYTDESNNLLYTARNYHIFIWDGSILKEINEVWCIVNDIETFNNKVYFAVQRGQVNDTVYANAIFEWDGEQLTAIYNTDWWIEKIYSDENYLYAAGDFDTIDNTAADGFAKFDGVQWQAIMKPDIYIHFIEKFNNSIYISNKWIDDVYYYKNNEWNKLNFDVRGINDVFSTNDAIYFAINPNGEYKPIVKKWDGVNLTEINDELKTQFPISKMLNKENQLYFISLYAVENDTLVSVFDKINNNWSYIYSPTKINSQVLSATFFKNDIYISTGSVYKFVKSK